MDELLAAQAEALGSSDDDGGSDSESDSGAASDSEQPRLPWWARNPSLLLSWASLAAVFALQPPGRRIPQTLDLAITTARRAACAAARMRQLAVWQSGRF
jgi:hypothetical protein